MVIRYKNLDYNLNRKITTVEEREREGGAQNNKSDLNGKRLVGELERYLESTGQSRVLDKS